jgi:hypothetical protein
MNDKIDKKLDIISDDVKALTNRHESKSAYHEWAQLNLLRLKPIRDLNLKSPRAVNILLFFIEKMDRENAIICSNTVLQEALDFNKNAITKAIKILKDCNFIDIMKSGHSNVYLINASLIWKSYGSAFRHCTFNAQIIISDSEQDKHQQKGLTNGFVTTKSIVHRNLSQKTLEILNPDDDEPSGEEPYFPE